MLPSQHPTSASSKKTAEQRKVARTQHLIFGAIEKGVAKGRKIRPMIQRHARRYEGTPGFAWQTLMNLLYHWRRSGRTVECLMPAWPLGRPKVTEEFLLAFVQFVVSEPRRLSLRAAYVDFTATLGAPPPIGYSAAIRHFPSSTFRKIQREWRAIAACKANAARLHKEANDKIHARFREAGL